MRLPVIGAEDYARRAAILGPRQEFLGEPRLADARLPLQHHHPAAGVDGVVGIA
jgi:hypothetical protein